jgi:hypothetical protein
LRDLSVKSGHYENSRKAAIDIGKGQAKTARMKSDEKQFSVNAQLQTNQLPSVYE